MVRSGMLGLLAAGAVFFPGLFLVAKGALKHLMGWPEGDAVVLSTRLVSSLQAILASSAGWIITSSCMDVMEDRHWLTESYILFATPYFAYDVFAMFLCYWYKLQVKGHEEAGPDGRSLRAAVSGFLHREVLMVLHHVFMVAFCFPASLLWRQGKGDYFQGILFLAELSTPSVCLGKVLIQYQKQNSVLHKVNGVFMLLSFFSCRVLLFPYLYYAYSRYASIPLYWVPLVAPWQCNLGAALLWPLQLYWFALICRGALRQSGRRLKATGSTDSSTRKLTGGR
ncbi:ceramide synthase-like [Girardinichthys multiradiatus]|uniref:ceramide synthase-like n=1 Tax=Girardinichthys multiradiatus TaxID=208333 RepID=UPI001FACA155|nr:ceramide synthase-like [Girardinichthys multiradiatus]XP_047214229.1 ceramide synthase-like [Girardinichthys multiradiatus]